MPRRLRFIPPGGAVVEVTTRTVQSRLLLKPSRYLNSIILGVLGRAQRLYDVRIHDFFFMSNHYHLLISVDSALQLARFMGYLNGNLAKEVARLTGWRDKVWSRRYEAILVSSENKAQMARFRYIASHGLKENLIARAKEWPGVSSIKARLAGKDTLKGRWYDRTREFNARRKGLSATRDELAEIETVCLTPLPCLAHLSEVKTAQTLREIVLEVEESAATRHQDDGIETLGRREVLRQDPEARPRNSKRSPAPFSHCASKSERKRLWKAYCWFLSAYLEARERLRTGQRSVFPEGSFPAPAPFVDPAPAPG
jgi:REP element-mobilizing transposase RayT